MNSLALIFLAASNAFDLPPGMLSAVCYVESNHRPHVIRRNDGKGHSVGVCQIKLSTARYLGYKGSEEQLWKNPKTNAYWAAKYLKKQLKRYNGDARHAVAAYNAGSCRRKPNGAIINQKYIDKVFKAWGKEK